MSTEGSGGVGNTDWAGLTGYTPEAEQAGQKDLLDKDVFMEMLIVQLQNQDPLSPMENQEFTAQLASLTQVEQLRDANANLEALQLYQSSINNAQSVSLIGKSIKAAGDNITLVESGDAKLSFTLGGAASNVKVNIFDSEGNVVRTIEKENMDSGLNSIDWNGTDNNGNRLDIGDYTFTVSATDDQGASINAVTLIAGIVQGVRFDSGVPMLNVDGTEVSIGDIYEVKSE